MSRADDVRRVHDAIRVLRTHGFEPEEWEDATTATRLSRSCPWGLYLAARQARMCRPDGTLTRLGQMMSDPDTREPLRWEHLR